MPQNATVSCHRFTLFSLVHFSASRVASWIGAKLDYWVTGSAPGVLSAWQLLKVQQIQPTTHSFPPTAWQNMTDMTDVTDVTDSKYGSGSAAAPLPEVGPKVSAVILANKHLASLISLTFKYLRYWKSAWTMARENHTLKTPIIAHQLQYPFGLPSAGPSWCKQTWLTKLNPSQYIPILTLQALQALHDSFGDVEMILAPCSSGYVAGFWASWTWSNSDFAEKQGCLGNLYHSSQLDV